MCCIYKEGFFGELLCSFTYLDNFGYFRRTILGRRNNFGFANLSIVAPTITLDEEFCVILQDGHTVQNACVCDEFCTAK